MNNGEDKIVIERATPDDAEVICDIRDRAWLETYPNAELGITEDDVRLMAQGRDGEFVPRRVAFMRQHLDGHDDATDPTFVAKLDGNVVGYVSPGIDDADRHYISAIYVAPENQSRGVGGALMRQALDWLGGDQEVSLEVVSYNQNAIGFYESFGFETTDTEVPVESGRPEYLKSLPKVEMVLPGSSINIDERMSYTKNL